MTDDGQDVFRDELRGLDGDLYLCHLFAPTDKRAVLLLLYHAYADIARIPYQVSDAMLVAIRLQWWRDMIDMIARDETPDAPIGRALQAAALDPQKLHELVDGRAAFIDDADNSRDGAARAGGAMMSLALDIFGIDDTTLADLARQGGEGFELMRATPDEMSIADCRRLLDNTCAGFNQLSRRHRKAALPVFLPIGMARRQALFWPRQKSLLSYQLHLLKMAVIGRL